jgi:hypothetical protein
VSSCLGLQEKRSQREALNFDLCSQNFRISTSQKPAGLHRILRNCVMTGGSSDFFPGLCQHAAVQHRLRQRFAVFAQLGALLDAFAPKLAD